MEDLIIKAANAELLHIKLTGKPDFGWGNPKIAKVRLWQLREWGAVTYLRKWLLDSETATWYDRSLKHSIVWKLLRKYHKNVGFEDFKKWCIANSH